MRVAIGLVGSSGMARVKRRNGFTHQRCAMPLSMAKTGSLVSSDSASGASRKLDVVERDDRVRPGLVEVLDALHLEAVEGAEQDREEVAERAGRQGAAITTATPKVGDADQDEQHRRRDVERLQRRDDDGAGRP